MTLPIHVLCNPEIHDGDIRVLLILDQIGWREGDRDGLVRASSEEIGMRIGKTEANVRASLRRLESATPPIIAREKFATNHRCSIRLLYDRYGGAPVNGKAMAEPGSHDDCIAVVATETTALQPHQSCDDCSDLESVVANQGGSDCNAVVAKSSRLPIRERHLLLLHQGGSDCNGVVSSETTESQSGPPAKSLPPAPKTLPELLAWLPAITDDPRDIERLTRKVPLWIARLHDRCPEHAAAAIDWVQDALIAASDKDDPVTYAQKLLAVYVARGGRPEVELANPVLQANPNPEAAPPAPAPAPPGRTTAAQRAAAERERIRETFRLNKIRKEAIHGDRA